MSASIKLHQLKSKISDLQSKYQDLLKERQQEIALLISTIDLAHLDDKTMIGGLLFLKNKITIQDPILEAWHDAGEKFLRQHKSRSHSRFQPREKENRSGRSRQTDDKKHISPKQAHIHQATNQSPQELPQQGEK